MHSFDSLSFHSLVWTSILFWPGAIANFDPLQYVDTLIGSAGGGDVFSGATLPYGLAKASPDTDASWNMGGFTLDGNPIYGFSVLHDSGTGGASSLGNFPLFPFPNCQDNDISQCPFYKYSRIYYGGVDDNSVKTSPGFFGITMDNGVVTEMTVTHRTALFNFTFPASTNGSLPVLYQELDDLQSSRQDTGTINIDPETGRITGGANFLPSFGVGEYAAYFCTDFSGGFKIHDVGTYYDIYASTDVLNLTVARGYYSGVPIPAGAFVRFEPLDGPVLARVGVSFLSSEQACANAEAEIPDFDFAAVQSAAVDAWREKLSPIVVDTKSINSSLLTTFYSGIYRTMINPQNYTGENPLWHSSEPYFDSFYCLWDFFRSQLPFLTILDPAAVTEMIRSLIDTYRYEGWLPDCRMSFCQGYTQGGSNADNVLADAYLKGLTDGIDWATGYEAVLKDAESEPFSWATEGRGGINSWKSMGFIPVHDFDYIGYGLMTRSVSRSLEYAYNDFCIAQMAEGLGDEVGKAKYLDQSDNWKLLWNSEQVSYFWNGTNTGFVGFFQPRVLNGSWGYQDPLVCSNLDTSGSACSLQVNTGETFESSLWEYGFFVPHNQAELITTLGGPDAFVERLNFLHDAKITFIGNEPAFLTVFQYHYAGRPALSAERAHFYIPSYFNSTPSGLPGNDDGGAMGSFLAFSMMGLFPNPGQNVYLITPPFFESVNITHPLTGKTAVIRNVNFDPTYDAIYIQFATLDGQNYTKNWIDHSFFTEGKELVLTLGKQESTWGQAVEDLPPSVGEYVGFS
ncbi:putative alpha-1,2-mannosidase family protein [Xylariales sp. PMI_506]|nr:putative alpha-1,2-mannosidase family protein [Xylariales sp. PMI_506]